MQIEPALFDAFSNPAMKKIGRVRFEHAEDSRKITGWLTPKERQTLYALGRHIAGPFLEIGPWCGLSTVAIARGIQDSGQLKVFRTCDLGLTIDHFRPNGDGVGMFVDGVNMGNCTNELFLKDIRPVLSQPGGAVGVLTRNLETAGVRHLVDIEIGDFKKLSLSPAYVVFCDTLHTMTEVETNGPALAALLRPGAILACHDIGRELGQIERLKEIVPIRHHTTVDSLLVADIARF